MIINFRQGIISYPSTGGVQKFLIQSGSNVNLVADNGVIDVAFAHRTTNYLHTESVTVPNAWSNIPVVAVVWLYWDIDILTGARTFGFTDLEPYAQNSAPTNPEEDQHWFDTSSMIMKVWNGTRWQEVIRVFAAEYNPASGAFLSVSVLSTSQRFDGTQIGSPTGNYTTGRIITDNIGRAVRTQSGVFLTTEDEFFVNGSPITAIRLESNVLTARCGQPVAKNQVVKFVDFDTVEPATYNDLQTTAIAMAVSDAARGDVGSFIVQGVVTDLTWNWPTVGAPVWVLTGGELVTTDPRITNPLSYPVGKAPVARVIGRHSVFFDQGLGGKGEKGDAALPSNAGEAATQFELGKVKLTVAPADPGAPYAVETSDPRMSNARPPLQHNHPATDIQPAIFGTNVNGSLQRTLENLESAKLNKNGDTVAGDILIPTISTNPAAAVPKRYVDTFVPLTQKGTANGVATLDASGRLTLAQLPQITVTDTFVCMTEAEMLALNAQTGDIAIRADVHSTYILKGDNPTDIGNWQELLTRPDGVTWIDVVSGSQQGLVATGGPVQNSGTITLTLANDIAAIEALQGTGIAHRTGADTWEVKAVDVGAGPSGITGILPMENGGTGLSAVTGYIKGNGATYTVLDKIPGADVQGTVPSSASTPWAGITSKPSTLAGYGIIDAYTKAETNALTWNWSTINNKPTTLVGYGITDVYSKTEINTYLDMKADRATTLAGYGITDAALSTHNHPLDMLSNVNTASKSVGDVIAWNGSNWTSLSISNSVLPTTLSGKYLDNTNTINVQDDKLIVESVTTSTKRFRFDAGQITANTTRVLTIPDASGTIALTNGAGATGNWNINATSANTVPWTGVSGTPTTVNGYGITDAYTMMQVDALHWDWSVISSTPTTLAGYGITDAYTKAETNALTWNWSAITNKPSTLAGYGIGDAYTKAETNARTWNWSAITNKPSTLAGYGITDAAPQVHNHDALYLKPSDIGDTVAGLDITGKLNTAYIPDQVYGRVYTASSEAQHLALPAIRGDIVVRTDESKTYVLRTTSSVNITDWTQLVFPEGGGGTVTSVQVTGPSAGIVATGGPIASSGTIQLSLSNDLAAVESLSSTGYVRRTATDTWSTTSTIPTTDLSGVVSISNGGTGATSASQALTALGGVNTTGIGASGTWGINITGSATYATTAGSVTNGVVTTGSYNNPSWITELDPSKVVATWTGNPYINQTSAEVNFGGFVTETHGTLTTNVTASTLIDVFDADDFTSAKYLVQVTSPGMAMLAELFITVDDGGNVFINQSGTGSANEPATFAAVLNGTSNSVEVFVSSASSATTRYVFKATRFRS